MKVHQRLKLLPFPVGNPTLMIIFYKLNYHVLFLKLLKRGEVIFDFQDSSRAVYFHAFSRRHKSQLNLWCVIYEMTKEVWISCDGLWLNLDKLVLL